MNDRRQLIEPNYPNLSIREQCKLLEVNRSGYYYEALEVDEQILLLMRQVDVIYTQYPFFGSRQMTLYLNRQGVDVGREKIRGIYKRLGLRSVAPGPHTSKPHPEHKVYPYLLRGLKITHKNQVWSTDITYMRMRKGFCYLVAIIDWFSRYVLDWQLSISLEADFCIETLARVLATGQCEIFNTDQGAQFTCTAFTELLINKQIKISMDGKGRAIDNVFIERLWRSVKYECGYLQEWDTVFELKKALTDYFKFYNFIRPHQGIGGGTPAEIYFQ